MTHPAPAAAPRGRAPSVRRAVLVPVAALLLGSCAALPTPGGRGGLRLAAPLPLGSDGSVTVHSDQSRLSTYTPADQPDARYGALWGFR